MPPGVRADGRRQVGAAPAEAERRARRGVIAEISRRRVVGPAAVVDELVLHRIAARVVLVPVQVGGRGRAAVEVGRRIAGHVRRRDVGAVAVEDVHPVGLRAGPRSVELEAGTDVASEARHADADGLAVLLHLHPLGVPDEIHDGGREHAGEEHQHEQHDGHFDQRQAAFGCELLPHLNPFAGLRSSEGPPIGVGRTPSSHGMEIRLPLVEQGVCPARKCVANPAIALNGLGFQVFSGNADRSLTATRICTIRGRGVLGPTNDEGSGGRRYWSLVRRICTRALTSTVSAALSDPALARNCSKCSIARCHSPRSS